MTRSPRSSSARCAWTATTCASRATAQQRAQAGEQLLALERLDEVVVGAGVEALDAGLDRVARGEHEDRHVVGDLSLNPDTHEVQRGERQIELTQREFELLEYLMRNERIVVPRQSLLEEVWGYDPFATTNTIEVFVSNLRRKLEAGGEPRLLHTIRGAGYVLRA